MATAASETYADVAFGTGEVVKIVGVPQRTLDAWEKRRIIEPSIQPAAGSGRTKLYSFRDLVLLRTAAELRALGVDFSVIRGFLDIIRGMEQLPTLTERVVLIRRGQDVYPLLAEEDTNYTPPGDGTVFGASLRLDLWAITQILRGMVHLRRKVGLDLDRTDIASRDAARAILAEIEEAMARAMGDG